MTEHKNWQEIRSRWYERAKLVSLETLLDFLKELAEFPHDYNTICYALAAGAVATCWAMDRTPNGGITGFQAGAVMWEFMEAWNGIKAPAWLRKGEDMLYPQYADKFTSISPDTWKWLQEEAGRKLAQSDDGMVAGAVVAHWKAICAGQVPFGLKVAQS